MSHQLTWEIEKTTESATLYKSELVRDYYAKVERFIAAPNVPVVLWYIHRTDSGDYVKWGAGYSLEDAKERAAAWIMERILVT